MLQLAPFYPSPIHNMNLYHLVAQTGHLSRAKIPKHYRKFHKNKTKGIKCKITGFNLSAHTCTYVSFIVELPDVFTRIPWHLFNFHGHFTWPQLRGSGFSSTPTSPQLFAKPKNEPDTNFCYNKLVVYHKFVSVFSVTCVVLDVVSVVCL